jgi:prophage antirepressor-like protein
MSQKFEIVNLYGVSCYEQDGTAYLRLEDVARGLGFVKKADSGNIVVNWTRVRQYLSDLGVEQKCTTGDYIPENIFYRLAMKAKNEAAEKFQALVADEIIPSIRKTGGYIVGQEQMTDDELLSAALLVAQNKIAERDKRIAALSSKNKQLKETNEYLTPRSDYCDAVLQSTSTYTVTDIAKEYGWTAARMNTKLHDIGLQYFCKSKRGDKMITHWYLYSKFDGEGFVEYETTPYFDKETCKKKSSKHMRWTERGKAYIYERLKKEGILPRSEASRKVKEG